MAGDFRGGSVESGVDWDMEGRVRGVGAIVPSFSLGLSSSGLEGIIVALNFANSSGNMREKGQRIAQTRWMENVVLNAGWRICDGLKRVDGRKVDKREESSEGLIFGAGRYRKTGSL